MLNEIRRKLLYRAFELLYGPLVLLHEPLGELFHGPAWKGRRLALLREAMTAGWVIEVGAGEGRLVRALGDRAIQCAGYEPSAKMRGRARRRSTNLIPASAQSLPLPDGMVDMILVSYPGPWIFKPETWHEFARVMPPGGQVRVVVGGCYGKSAGQGLRAGLLAAIYGSSARMHEALGSATSAGFRGEWVWTPDPWGAALLWQGELTDRGGSLID